MIIDDQAALGDGGAVEGGGNRQVDLPLGAGLDCLWLVFFWRLLYIYFFGAVSQMFFFCCWWCFVLSFLLGAVFCIFVFSFFSLFHSFFVFFVVPLSDWPLFFFGW